MKKFVSILLICLLIFSSLLTLASCKEKENGEQGNDNNQNQSQGQTPIEDNKIHLIVLAGQSGARGKAPVKDLDEADSEDNVDVDILADGLPMGELGNIPSIDESLYIDVLAPGYGDFPSEFGPEIGMGQTMASRYPKFDSEYKSVIVKYTASGSTFTDHWYSSSAIADDEISALLNLDQVSETAKGGESGPLTANLYALVEKAVADLEELGYEVVIDGMAFVHGEQDAKFDDNMLIYEKALTHFINDFRAYFGNENMPVVITEALTNSAMYSNDLRTAQANVCAKLDRVSLIETDDLYTNTFEPWHFGAESNNILGNRIAAEIISNNDTRVVKSIDEEVIELPYGVDAKLPAYVKATFTNYYSGYLKVEEYLDYDCNKLGEQTVRFKARTGEGTKEFSLKVNVKENVAIVDGILNEYAGAKNNIDADLGELYVIKGESGLYIGAKINDSLIYTDGENWNRGDMGQKGNNDDFIVYVTDSSAEERTTLCLSAANLLRVYPNGIGLDREDVVLEYNNLVYNKKIQDYKHHVVIDGLANGGSATSVTFEIYISYADLGIEDPNLIKMCFGYSDIDKSGSGDSFIYVADGEKLADAEKNLEAYFDIDELINQ